jgi:hypothetical protein
VFYEQVNSGLEEACRMDYQSFAKQPLAFYSIEKGCHHHEEELKQQLIRLCC